MRLAGTGGRALAQHASRHMTGTVLTVTASQQRSQRQNRKAARERLAALSRHEGGDAASTARGGARARARVYHTPSTKGGRHLRRRLRQALTGIALAAALLGALQLLALNGISSARQAALAERSARATTQAEQPRTEQAAPPAAQTAPQPVWVTEDTGAAYSSVDPSASPLDLPRCTTSPDTPLPCLATVSADSSRAVVLEEDASLTALVRR